MSRTYRKIMEWKYDAYGRLWTNEELDAAGLNSRYVRVPGHLPAISFGHDGWQDRNPHDYHLVYITPGLKGREVLNRMGRDKKHWDKPPKWFKQMHRRIERTRMNQALAQHRPLPVFKCSDQWHWT